MGLVAIAKQILGVDIPRIRLNEMARRRPYPYDTTATLALTDGGAPDTFPAGYTLLIAAVTYDFGDNPNRIRVYCLKMEVMPADTYVIEFYRSYDAVTYTPIGANRVSCTIAITLGFGIDNPCRALNIDTGSLYGRLKSATGGQTVNFALCVMRWQPPTVVIPISPGVWPWA